MSESGNIKSRLVDTPIVIDEWKQDDTYDGIFPKGARDKSVYFSPVLPPEPCLKGNYRYLFKLSRNWCPWQFWMEIIAYRLGLLIGITVPPAHIGLSRTYEPGKDTYGTLIEWFFDEKKDVYLEGGQYMMQRIKDYDREKGTQHNFTDIQSGFNGLPDFVKHWAGSFTLDCLIGNTDRHQDNWGLVVENGKLQSTKEVDVHFSPAFDNGTALGYEIREADIDKYRDPARLHKYLTNPQHARHHMKWSLEQERPLNFYEFLRQFVLEFQDAGPIIALQYVGFSHSQLAELLEPLVNAVSDETYALTQQRLDFILQLIMNRKELIRQALGL